MEVPASPTGDSTSPSRIATSPQPDTDASRAPQTETRLTPATGAPARARPVKQYGRKKEEQQPIEAGEAPARPLERRSTEVIPETDFPMERTESPEREEEDKTSPVRRGFMTSSPSSRRAEHSTDPTSEDEGSPVKAKPTRHAVSFKDGLDALLASSDAEDVSEAGGDDEADDPLAAFVRGKNIQALLAEVDDEFDNAELNCTPLAKLPTVPDHIKLQTSSSLPTLTPSTLSPSKTSTVRRANSPSSPSHALDGIEDILGSLESEEVLPTAQRGKKARRVIDSDEDEDDEEAPTAKSKHRSAVPDSSDAEQDEPAAPSTSTSTSAKPASTALSARDRLLALASKKRTEKEAKDASLRKKTVSPAPKEDEDDLILSEEERERGKKGKKATQRKSSKLKPLSKKEEAEMQKMTEAIKRQQEAHLAPSHKAAPSVADIFKRTRQLSPPPAPINRIRNASVAPLSALTLSSSDSDAIVTSSPSHIPATPQPGPAGLSLKALGKQCATSPIDDADMATPVPHRVRMPKPPPGWGVKKVEPVAAEEDDEEELLSLDEMNRRADEKRKKEEKAKRLREAKMAALRAAKEQAQRQQAEDSDSDLDIEGAPGASKKKKAVGRKVDPRHLSAQTPVRPKSEALRVLARFGGVNLAHPPSDDADPSESQLVTAAKTFGSHLDPKNEYRPSPAKRTSRRAATAAPPTITLDVLGEGLLKKNAIYNVKLRTMKQTKYRQKQLEEQARPAEQPQIASVNVKEILEKKQKQAEEDEEMEDAEDGDYREDGADAEEAYDSAAGASDSDDPFGGHDSDAPMQPTRSRNTGVGDAEEDEGEIDSEGEPVMPRSSQNSERLRGALLDEDDEEEEAPVGAADEESEMPPPAATRRTVKVRIMDDDDSQDAIAEPAPTEVVTTAAPPKEPKTPAGGRFALGGLLGDAGDAGGFSQFFDSQFSQGGDDEGDGFLRPKDGDFDAPAPTMFAAQPLISTAERAADAARLEARGGFNDFEPGTPREAPAPRQYINDKGFLTQTRPANLFDSPSDSPMQFYRNSLSTRDSQSQALDETQVATAQTPTQAPRDSTKLRRTNALVAFDSMTDIAPTEVQLAPTENVGSRSTDDQTVETQETQDAMPSAAQPTLASTKNAFDLLRAGAAQDPDTVAPALPKRRERNQFVDAEANLSDEEEALGLGGVSGDEDEDGHDAELESLVDNEEVDREIQDEQDRLAAERYAEDQAKADEAAQLRAQRIVDGKERQKRKGYLSDDDFDDDYINNRRPREKRQRVEDMTTAQLKENEETQAFGTTLETACVPTAKPGEYNFLEAQEQSEGEDDDRDEGEGGIVDVFGRKESPVPVRSIHEARAMAIQMQKEKYGGGEDMLAMEVEEEERFLRGFSPDVGSSSPVAPLKLNNRVTAKLSTTTVVQATRTDDYDELDSQYSLVRIESAQLSIQYKASDDLHVAGVNGSRGGQAITSFKQNRAKLAAKADGGVASKTKALGPRASRLADIRRGGFA
ncbi:hypothetical protein NBRC10512_006273 [Rhodotorula toruloides]|uniref:RHTO0S05e02388g1_1 n=2 Tax=Rhodotorula toruloides TaxID=5286 RepID=A0A061B037_RHOTO|nr:uncharacterized protein RHTO_02436 [Rhodotorula toruloides NP11]EMS20820.1 hypothetical protein RHTO_02436 [Rhodotorula toruloides NP11]CDR40365.1 RHTO0S05e02388g1_1 [Rhodotorula toruloides]